MFAGRAVRTAVASVVLVLLLAGLLVAYTGGAGGWSSAAQQHYAQLRWRPSDDKIVVVASVSGDDTNWLETLPIPYALYVTDDPYSRYKVPLNRGNEAMVYLTYICDHYYTLPKTMAFIHSHQSSWHNDAFDGDMAQALQHLNWTNVERHGFFNLRCSTQPGCPVEIVTSHITSGRETEAAFSSAWRHAFQPYLGAVPDVVGTACCAQIAVSAKQVHTLPLRFYEHVRQWLIDSELNSATSGRVLEYAWHIMFGKPHVWCEDENVCRCLVYGLDCKSKPQSGD